MDSVDLRSVRHFLAVYETRSISAAADLINLTQPALSRSLKELESRLGVLLFDRLPRGVQPTLYGDALAEHATIIRAEVRNATAHLMALSTGDSGTVRIGAGPTWTRRFLPLAVARINKRSPRVQFNVVGGLADELHVELTVGNLDLVLSALPRATELDAALTYEPLIETTVVVVARKDHPLHMEARPRLARLLDHPWILTGWDHEQREILAKMFRTQGLAAPSPTIESSSFAFAMTALREGDFLSFQVVEHLAGADARNIVPLWPSETGWRRTAGIWYRRHGTLAPAARMLADELKDVCRTVSSGVSDTAHH